jgi:hypothetical protein
VVVVGGLVVVEVSNICAASSERSEASGGYFRTKGKHIFLEEAESRRAADTAEETSCKMRTSGFGDRGSWGAGYGGGTGP